ncbi:MAG: preprotein translocase subunit SecG [Pseudomonadota bacterium]
MTIAVLILHVVICIGLVGLVLLQRSEGGALGIGGGSGALMTGRGAADALAKMTTFAGGFFLCTSLILTVMSGGAQSSATRSIFDSAPPAHQSLLPLAPAPTPAPTTTTPVPAGPSQSETAATTVPASINVAPAPQSTDVAPAATAATQHAGPIATTLRANGASTAANHAAAPPSQNSAAHSQPAAVHVSTPATTPQHTAVTVPTHTASTTNTAAHTQPANRSPLQGVPSLNQSNLTGNQTGTESAQTSGQPAPTHRERAGPDQ